ncbi:MAG: DEAD/DEAH box helicase [Bacillota bacterium]
MITLRDYQKDALRAVLAAQKRGVTRPLIALPTGTGKTIIFAALARLLGARALILAHRDELIRQAVDKVLMVWPDASVGVIKADENDFRDKQVVVASVQTLSKPSRLEQVAHQDFNLLVVDEAHHAVASTYRRIMDYLMFLEGEPERLLLGVTATARRGDRVGLGNIFEEVVYSTTILTMVRAGYLCDIRGIRVSTGADLSKVATRRGDFVESQLSLAVNTPERNGIVVAAYLHYAAGRKALAFTVDVQHAKDLAIAFKENGVEAKVISGNTPEEERRETLRAFRRGEIQVITNCAVLTEGYDEPSLDCILMARPTKSATLYTQCIGRGTRLFPGKQDCLVIDFADNRHDVCALPTLLGFGLDRLTRGQSVREEIEAQERRKVVRPIYGVSAEEFDLLGKSVFRWIQAGHQWRLPIAPQTYAVLSPDGDKYRVLLVARDERPQLLHPTALTIGYAQGIAEDYARQHGKAFSRRDAAWRQQPATEKQVDLLRKLGFNPTGITKGQASDILEEFFANRRRRA